LDKLNILKFFIKDKEKIERIIKAYIHHRNLYCKGQSEFGFAKSLVSLQAIMITWLFLKSTFPFLENWMFFTFAPALVVFKIIFQWWLGYWWEINDFYDRESDWCNKRNPVIDKLGKTLEQ
jgi:hypothetical protein